MDSTSLTVLLQLVRIANIARSLDQNVWNLENGVKSQQESIHSLQQRLLSNLERFGRLATSNRSGAEKLTQNSTRIMEWLNQAENIDRLFEKNHRELQNVYHFLNQILPSMKSMVEVASKVQDILELLHLLSVNTAIEAARQGEQGKVFTVIAKQMRTLSESSGFSMKEIQKQAQRINGQIKDLLRMLSSSMEISSSLHQTANKFLKDSDLIKKNTQSVLSLVLQYQDLVETQAREWELSMDSIEDLEGVGRVVLNEATSLRQLSEELSSSLLKEAELLSGERTEIHEKALEEAKAIAHSIDGSALQDTERLNHILRSFSDRTKIFELLYAMNREGLQVSWNIYAPTHRQNHEDTEGYLVDRREKSYFRIPMETQREYFSPLYVSTATKALCITVAVPLKRDQEIYGVLCADIDLNRLCAEG